MLTFGSTRIEPRTVASAEKTTMHHMISDHIPLIGCPAIQLL